MFYIFALQFKIMEVIKGFNKITYNDLQVEIKERLKELGKSDVDVAASAAIKSVQSIKNIYNDEQIVSDELLTKVFEIAGVKAAIVYDTTGTMALQMI